MIAVAITVAAEQKLEQERLVDPAASVVAAVAANQDEQGLSTCRCWSGILLVIGVNLYGIDSKLCAPKVCLPMHELARCARKCLWLLFVAFVHVKAVARPIPRW